MAAGYVTSMDSLEQLTGRALDAAVAQHVFGYEIEVRKNRFMGAPEYGLKDGGEWFRVPLYSHHLSASILLEDRLRVLGWTRLDGAFGDVRAILRHADGHTVEATGATMGEALSKAALKTASRT